MLHISQTLKYYKQRQVQAHILEFSKDREIATRYGNGFGKRPELIYYPNDILSLVQNGATSFHSSEEHWSNVQQLSTKLSKKEQEELRKGWDLILDIDCPLWDYARLVTHYLILELKAHGIKNISVKFSGSKGFHIGVPFSSFPDEVHGKPTKLLFPEGIRRIAAYLKDRIEKKLLSYLREGDRLNKALQDLGVTESDLFYKICAKCKKKQKLVERKTEFICSICNNRIFSDEKYVKCEKCNIFMEKFEHNEDRCSYCSSKEFKELYDLSPLIEIDTVLISSRHLYRMPYSLHEKTGFASVPIELDKVLNFQKELAHPNKISYDKKFMDPSINYSGEATDLILQAFDFNPDIEIEEVELNKEYDIPQEAIPMELFPPCIKLGLQGLQDGKKRFLFALINFLKTSGWQHDQMVELVKDWNSKNPEPLRETIVETQLRYAKNKKALPPPNCDNEAYMIGLGICKPDGLCRKIKNPVQYPARKSYGLNNKSKTSKKTENKKVEKKEKDKKEDKKDI